MQDLPTLEFRVPKADDILAEMIVSSGASRIDQIAMGFRAKKLTEFIDQQARDRDSGNSQVTIFTEPSRGSPAEAAEEGGKHILVLKPSAVKLALSSDNDMRQFLGVVGHEFTHFNNKDSESERKNEFLADLGGAGPLGTRDPEGLIGYITDKVIKGNIVTYNKAHADALIDSVHITKDNLRAISDWIGKGNPDHPSPLERIAALEMESAMLKEGLRKGETPAEQERRIIETIMKRLEDGQLPEASMMKASSLPQEVVGKLPGMNPMPMLQVDGHNAAFVPAPVQEPGGLQK